MPVRTLQDARPVGVRALARRLKRWLARPEPAPPPSTSSESLEQLSDDAFVEYLYRRVLDRECADSERAAWCGALGHVDGQPLGAILRVPRSDDVRSNIHVGGTVVATDLDLHDRRIIETMGPRLVRDGLWLVGIDVIGGKLTEVNVTSPTGIQQMSRLAGENLEARVIDSLERKVLDSASVRRAVHV